MAVRKIENNTARMIYLPPINGIQDDRAKGSATEAGDAEADGTGYIDFPNGVRLVPGLNTVPEIYYNAMLEQTALMYDQLGFPRMDKKHPEKQLVRWPGKEILASLIADVNIVTANGTTFGPMITVYEDAQVGREDGPPAPATLPANPEAAKVFILATDDRAALTRWAKATKDSDIKLAIQGRLAGLK